jgi:mycothiol synthase
MAVSWQPLSTDTVAEWTELTNVLAEADGTEEFYDAEDLAEELREAGVDPALDTIGVWQDGALVGYGQLRVGSALLDGEVQAQINGGIHPDARRQGLGTQLMDRMEARARQLAARRHPGAPVLLRVPGGLEGASVRAMLERRGYHVLRYHHELVRPIPGVLPEEPSLPVQRYTPELEEAVRLAHNDAFSAHWGSTPIDPQRWHDNTHARAFRPECSFLSCAPADGQDADPTVLAYVFVAQWVPGEAWVSLVGTRPAARGAGLARACLAASLRAMAEQGYVKAGLAMDSENSTGAGALYASLGFELDKVTATYGKVEPAPDGR